MFTDEGDLSNYLEVNIKRTSDREFELSQSHLVEKIIKHFGLTVSVSLKARETPPVKTLLHKDESSLGSNCIWNYRVAAGMLNYLQGSTRPETSISVHQFVHFYNNPHLVHERTIRHIANYLASMSTYIFLPDGN